jgi:hypothetical protein
MKSFLSPHYLRKALSRASIPIIDPRANLLNHFLTSLSRL